MNRILRRPMFRTGGSAEGITSGLQPRQGYKNPGRVLPEDIARMKMSDIGNMDLGQLQKLSRSMSCRPQRKYGSDFWVDFGLNLASNKSEMEFTKGYLGYRSSIRQVPKRVTIIRKKSRPWMKKDAEFWSKYLISKKTLIKFAVSPISHYWINESRFSCELSYAYKIGTKYKIYSPHDEVKWMSNTNSKQIQGYDQLPKQGDLCIITSSLKDVMCLFEMGIPAVAMQSEMRLPLRNQIEELKQRFKQVAIFYDNDFTNPNNPGQAMAAKICKEYYPIKNIVIPDEYGVKDLSDYIAKFKRTEGLKTLIDIQL